MCVCVGVSVCVCVCRCVGVLCCWSELEVQFSLLAFDSSRLSVPSRRSFVLNSVRIVLRPGDASKKILFVPFLQLHAKLRHRNDQMHPCGIVRSSPYLCAITLMSAC